MTVVVNVIVIYKTPAGGVNVTSELTGDQGQLQT